MSLTYIKDAKNCWTVVVNNKSYQFDSTDKDYDLLVGCVKSGDAEKFLEYAEKGETISEWAEGNFTVADGILKYGDEIVHNTVASRILEMIEQGFDYKPMLRFVENLYNNVSMRAVEELYNFLEHKYLPITPDGCFLAYKGVIKFNCDGDNCSDKMNRKIVKGDFVDKYTGHSYRNNVGDVNEMPRRLVNDNANIGCDQGLHVGSLEYASGYSDVVVICKVNPSDVVSVPYDCNCQKVRVAKYEVVGIYEGKKPERAVESSYEDEEEDPDLDEDWNDDEDDYEGDGWDEEEDTFGF